MYSRYPFLSIGDAAYCQHAGGGPSHELRVRDVGNMPKHLVKIARVVPEISSRTDRQTDRQTYSSQYFAINRKHTSSQTTLNELNEIEISLLIIMKLVFGCVLSQSPVHTYTPENYRFLETAHKCILVRNF